MTRQLTAQFKRTVSIAVILPALHSPSLGAAGQLLCQHSTFSSATQPPPPGEERTRRELIPFVNESVDDEDEILLALAEELGEFVPLVGGAQHAHCLLPPLEALATVDETVVRERAVASICGITAQMPHGAAEEHLLPLLQVGWCRGVGCSSYVARRQAGDALQMAVGLLGLQLGCHSSHPPHRMAPRLPPAAAEAGGQGVAGAGVRLQALFHGLPAGAGERPACGAAS